MSALPSCLPAAPVVLDRLIATHGRDKSALAVDLRLIRAAFDDVEQVIKEADRVAASLEMPALVKQSTKNENAGFVDWRDWCALLGEVKALRESLARVKGGA